jgi:aspartokinase
LHPLAISIAKTNNSLIRLRNICDISSPGTIILPCSRRVTKLGVEVEARATAITMRRDISLLTICSNQRLPSHVFLTKLFTVLERCKLRFLLMSTSGANVTLALPPSHSYVDKLPLPATPRSSSIVASTAAEIAKLNIGTLVQDTGYAVLSVVGEGVCTHAAMVGRCCEALAREGVNVEMISSSAPRLSVCVAMKEEMAVRAVMAVHYELFGGGGRVGNKDRAE